MRVLIYGYKGWIGSQFLKILRNDNKVEVVVSSSRADDFASVSHDIEVNKPTHVISFIGRTHGEIDGKKFPTIDYLEQPNKLPENLRDNLLAPLTLAIACQLKKVHYTYLGTGCIFDYDDERDHKGFTEDDSPNFTGSAYSSVKGVTDTLMHLYSDTVLNLRIRMPIVGEDNPRNFITKITQYDKICSIPNSMTVLPELLPLVLDMMKQKVLGTMNLTNPGVITHNEILTLYKKYVDPGFTWRNFSIEEQNEILDSKRSNNLLDTSRLQKLYPHVTNIHDAVERTMKNYMNTSQQNNNKIKLLVTGGCGFIGSHFINHIFNEYDDIYIYNIDAMYYCADEKNVSTLVTNSNRYQFIYGNIQDTDLLKTIFDNNQITHIVHFAAQSHVQNSFDDSIQYTQDNVLGTHCLLESARLNCPTLQKFIHVSTDEVYGESMLEDKFKTEQSILCPTNPYAATKASAELIAQSYCHSFNMPIIVTRGNNVYGPRQYPEKVIPRFIELLKMNKPVTLQGDGKCIRAFLHVDDTVKAFQCILERGELGEIYNIGCDEGMEYTIREVAEKLIRLIHNTTDYKKWITYIEDRPFNDLRYYISNEKLKQLGWTININFDDGLQELVC